MMLLWKIAEKMNKPDYQANPSINNENADKYLKKIDLMTDEHILEILAKALETGHNKKQDKLVN